MLFENSCDDKCNSTPKNLLFENLVKSRCITLFSSINSATAKEVIEALLLLENIDNKAPINLFLNSPGGEINSGFAIYDIIRFIKPEVRIICSGLCASIATIILIAAKKENRYSLPNSKFLIHQPLIPGGISGQASDIEITAEQITKSRDKINRLLAEECGQALDKVEQHTDRDYWMTTVEAKEYGLVSKIINTHSEI